MSHYLLLIVLGRSEVLIDSSAWTHQGRNQVLPEVDQAWAALYEKKKNNTNNNNTQSEIPTN